MDERLTVLSLILHSQIILSLNYITERSRHLDQLKDTDTITDAPERVLMRFRRIIHEPLVSHLPFTLGVLFAVFSSAIVELELMLGMRGLGLGVREG